MDEKKDKSRFEVSEESEKGAAARSTSRIIAGAFFFVGLGIAAYLFREEQVWLRKFALLLVGLSVVHAAFEHYEARIGFRPLVFIKSVFVSFGFVTRGIFILVAILPIIVFELLSGPAALLGAAIFTISIPIYALESWAKVDVVPVDLSGESDTLFLVIAGAVGCWGVLLLRHYVFAKYGIMEKIYDKLGDGFAK